MHKEHTETIDVRTEINDFSMEDIIKLKLTERAQELKRSEKVMDTFIESCIRLDASIFEPLIEEDQLFQDLDKYRFLHSMKQLFDYMKDQDFDKMELKIGSCQGCHMGHVTHEFYAEGLFEFAYIMYLENGVLKDIFRCNFSTRERFNFYPF